MDGQDRELRSALLAVALSETRQRAAETRARYAKVARKVTATEEDTAALASRMAELVPERAERLRALSSAAGEAARESRQAASGEDRVSATLMDPGTAGPALAGANSIERMRLQSKALARRLEQAIAGARQTSAQIQQGPRG